MAKTVAVEFTDPLADLRGPYITRLRNRVDGLSKFLAACRERLPNEAMLAEHHRCVHSMVSSAAIFGHARLSALAREAERAFEAHAETGEMNLVRQIEDLVSEAETVLKSACSQ